MTLAQGEEIVIYKSIMVSSDQSFESQEKSLVSSYVQDKPADSGALFLSKGDLENETVTAKTYPLVLHVDESPTEYQDSNSSDLRCSDDVNESINLTEDVESSDQFDGESIVTVSSVHDSKDDISLVRDGSKNEVLDTIPNPPAGVNTMGLTEPPARPARDKHRELQPFVSTSDPLSCHKPEPLVDAIITPLTEQNSSENPHPKDGELQQPAPVCPSSSNSASLYNQQQQPQQQQQQQQGAPDRLSNPENGFQSIICASVDIQETNSTGCNEITRKSVEFDDETNKYKSVPNSNIEKRTASSHDLDLSSEASNKKEKQNLADYVNDADGPKPMKGEEGTITNSSGHHQQVTSGHISSSFSSFEPEEDSSCHCQLVVSSHLHLSPDELAFAASLSIPLIPSQKSSDSLKCEGSFHTDDVSDDILYNTYLEDSHEEVYSMYLKQDQLLLPSLPPISTGSHDKMAFATSLFLPSIPPPKSSESLAGRNDFDITYLDDSHEEDCFTNLKRDQLVLSRSPTPLLLKPSYLPPLSLNDIESNTFTDSGVDIIPFPDIYEERPG